MLVIRFAAEGLAALIVLTITVRMLPYRVIYTCCIGELFCPDWCMGVDRLGS